MHTDIFHFKWFSQPINESIRACGKKKKPKPQQNPQSF